jgi:hypothetical protein
LAHEECRLCSLLLPVLDLTALTPTLIAEAVKLFDGVSGKEFRPLHEINNNPVRRELDEKFAPDMLGLAAPIFASDGPLELLRTRLARELSNRGHQ